MSHAVKVGVLGGGQLAEMLAQAATPIGIKVFCIEKSADTCASQVAPVVAGDLTDPAVINRWITDSGVDVVTYESEFIDASIARALSGCEVRPSADGLLASQERLREKSLFVELGIPVPEFVGADDPDELRAAVSRIGMPCVVKTRSGGYDGKGQVVVRAHHDLEAAVTLVETNPVIVESFVNFDRELSVVGVRGSDGRVRVYPVVENEHRNGILHRTTAPAPHLDQSLEHQARSYITRLLENLDYVGVLGFELFAVGDVIMGNEFAPRVHNSGHWTIEGAVTSQFENHLRAITGLPLGSTEARSPAGMVNLVGGTPDINALLSIPEAKLHLYGKGSRPGRKIGHVTVAAADEVRRDELVREVEGIVQNVLGE